MMQLLRRYFISGLLVWLPIWITILAIKFLVDILGSTLLMLPKQYQPDSLIGFHIPGIGFVITIVIILLTGVFVANFLGRRVMIMWDKAISRIPLVRSIYTAVQQVLQTIFKPNGQSFRKVLLVEYPRIGMWTLAFQTGDSTPEVDQVVRSDGEPLISLFVPTTPNPTSGFLIMMPRKDVIELNMTVEQALKFVISLGVVQPVKNGGTVPVVSS